ncbi:hypothetical protein ACG3SL_00660 [Sphingomonas sp. CJ20]
MRRALCLAVLPVSLLCSGGVAYAQDGLDDPVTLFNTACLSGQARLSRTKFDDIAYGALPAPVRTVYGLAIDGARATPPAAPGDLEVPNRVLVSLPDKDMYLLLPASGAPGRAAEYCSVIWQGEHQDIAEAAAKAAIGDTKPLPVPALRPDTRYLSYRHSGTVITAAQLDRWTVLSIVSDPSTKERTTP